MARLGRAQPFPPKLRRPTLPFLTTVVFDSAATSGYKSSLSSYNFSITITAGNANRILFCGVGIFLTGSVTSIDAGGNAMAFVRADTNAAYRSEIWRLFAPPTGVVTITVTLNTSLTSVTNACSYYNSDQTTLDANNGNNGTNTPASASVTTIADLCTIFGNLAAQTASGITSAAGQFSRTTSNGALGTDASDDFGDVSPAGSKTLTWNGLGTLDSWAVSLVSLRPPQPPTDRQEWITILPRERGRTTVQVSY